MHPKCMIKSLKEDWNLFVYAWPDLLGCSVASVVLISVLSLNLIAKLLENKAEVLNLESWVKLLQEEGYDKKGGNLQEKENFLVADLHL